MTKVSSPIYYDAVGNPLNDDNYAYTWEHGRQLAALAVTSDFAIITQPEDGECLSNGTASFSIEAAGTGLTYQWQWKNGSVWQNASADGAQTNSISIEAAGQDGRLYRCVVTDGTGNVLISDSAEVVHVPILITSQPSDWWGTEDGTAVFTVEAVSTDANLTYQWKWKNGSTWTNTTAPGGTTQTMRADVIGINGATYSCFITDSSGNTVASEPVTIHTDPIGFISQPEDCVCSVNGKAVFSVEAYGTDVTYQWQYKVPDSTTWVTSQAHGAQTNSIWFLADFNVGMSYRCIITDAEGNTATSKIRQGTVLCPDIIG